MKRCNIWKSGKIKLRESKTQSKIKKNCKRYEIWKSKGILIEKQFRIIGNIELLNLIEKLLEIDIIVRDMRWKRVKQYTPKKNKE